MTGILPQKLQDSDSETCDGYENAFNEEDTLSDRLREVFVCLQDTLTISQAEEFYKVLFQERMNLKSFLTMYDSMGPSLRSKPDQEQAECLVTVSKK